MAQREPDDLKTLRLDCMSSADILERYRIIRHEAQEKIARQRYEAQKEERKRTRPQLGKFKYTFTGKSKTTDDDLWWDPPFVIVGASCFKPSAEGRADYERKVAQIRQSIEDADYELKFERTWLLCSGPLKEGQTKNGNTQLRLNVKTGGMAAFF